MKRFKNILCVLDPKKSCEPALDRAIALAEDNQAELTVVDVMKHVIAGIGMPEGGPISLDLQAMIEKEHAHALEKLVEPYQQRFEFKTKILIGAPFLEIIREVLKRDHDLVIKVPDSQDWLDRLFGSDDMHLLRKCPCPVWLIKPRGKKPFKRILAAIDVSNMYPQGELASRHALNRQILEMASSLALTDFAELHIVHAWDTLGENVLHGPFADFPKEKIEAYVDQVRRRRADNVDTLVQDVIHKLGPEALNYLKPEIHLEKGVARKEIPACAKRIGADLVVMGTVARTGVPGFIMGNTAETILNLIECSVLAIKPPGFITPVTLE